MKAALPFFPCPRNEWNGLWIHATHPIQEPLWCLFVLKYQCWVTVQIKITVGQHELDSQEQWGLEQTFQKLHKLFKGIAENLEIFLRELWLPNTLLTATNCNWTGSIAFRFMAGLWFNFTSNDIAKLDMVNLQHLHWRLGSDILSKWNFPVVPNTFYLISMLAVWNVTTYCHNDRWVKAQESNLTGFSDGFCMANAKIYFCSASWFTHLGVNGTRGLECNFMQTESAYIS